MDSESYRASHGANAQLIFEDSARSIISISALSNTSATTPANESAVDAANAALATVGINSPDQTTRMVDFSGLAVNDGVEYTMIVGGNAFVVTDVATPGALVDALVTKMAALNASKVAFTVTDMASVYAGLAALINADSQAPAGAVATASSITLTGGANNTSFVVSGSKTKSADNGTYAQPVALSGFDAAQKSSVVFGDTYTVIGLDTNGDPVTSTPAFDIANNHVFEMTVNGVAFKQAVTSTGDASAKWAQVLGDLRTSILAAENPANTAETLDDVLTIVVDAPNKTLNFTAKADNTPFTISGVNVQQLTANVVADAATYTETGAPGTSVAEVRTVNFDAITDANIGEYNYAVTVDAVTVNVSGSGKNRATVLSEIASSINTSYGAS